MYLIFFSRLLTISNGTKLKPISGSCGVLCQMIHDVSSSVCNDGDVIQLPNFAYFLNNQWGSDDAKPGYYQCLDGLTVSYSWWSINKADYSIKSFPAIITGWHWGYFNGPGNGNLPVIINSRPTIMVNWTVQHMNTGTYEWYNTAFDIWLGNIDEPYPIDPAMEVMIWMNNVNQSPLGFYDETIAIWNTEFHVHVHSMPGLEIFFFIQVNDTWSFNNVNLFDIFDYLWNTKHWIDGRQYICGIEAGNEIVFGQGLFTHSYSIKIN